MDAEQKSGFRKFLLIAAVMICFMSYIAYTEYNLTQNFEKYHCDAYVKRCVQCQLQISNQYDNAFINGSPLKTNPKSIPNIPDNVSFNFSQVP